MDIWLQEQQIPAIKSAIVSFDELDYRLLFDKSFTLEEKRKREKEVPMNEVLTFVAELYGNNGKRSITILDGGETKQMYIQTNTKEWQEIKEKKSED